MQFTLKALFDDETRKTLRDAVLGEARNVARAAIDAEIREEIKRVGASLKEKFEKETWFLKDLVNKTLRELIGSQYQTDIKETLMEMINKSVDQVVKKKLADKTVWEARSQEDYVRKVIRSEMRGEFLELAVKKQLRVLLSGKDGDKELL